MRILLLSAIRYPIAEPFSGGLESHTSLLAKGLRWRGHTLTVIGAPGSDPGTVDHCYPGLPAAAGAERLDISRDRRLEAAETGVYRRVLDDLASGRLGEFDVIHNNSLHHVPVVHAGRLPVPMLTTLHTPPLPWVQRRFDRSRAGGTFVAVSRATAALWQEHVDAQVVHNGIDTARWPLGPGGPGAVWSGRIVPEKAPHLAIDIAEAAGLELTLAGPVIDQGYFADQVAPRLTGGIRYAGHLPTARLADLVGTSVVALVTPMWDEPFGLVAAEAMSTGTPVVAFARGGLAEIVDDSSGRLLAPPAGPTLGADELADAVRAVRAAVELDRVAVRTHARRRLDVDIMTGGYERCYDQLSRRRPA